MSDDHAFITRFSDAGPGLRVAVKDLIDLRGSVTTAGCREVERDATPATADGACLAGIRAAEASGRAAIVGKTNLHELAFGITGVNAAYGTPVNPLDPARVPGGSSSGSAVAVATGEADVAIGTDTGGSIRIPAACCGVVGLKTTWGRVPLAGCRPLAPSLDTIGPLARTVADVVVGMDLLEPGFAAEAASAARPTVIGRLRHAGVAVDPAVDAAIDALLRVAGVEVVDVDVPQWGELQDTCLTLLLAEAWEADGGLLARDDHRVSEATTGRLRAGRDVTAAARSAAFDGSARALAAFDEVFARVEVIAAPSSPILAPLLEDAATAPLAAFTRPVNFAGLPSLALPAPVPPAMRQPDTAHLPAGAQLIGPRGAEARLVVLGELLERAAAG